MKFLLHPPIITEFGRFIQQYSSFKPRNNLFTKKKIHFRDKKERTPWQKTSKKCTNPQYTIFAYWVE